MNLDGPVAASAQIGVSGEASLISGGAGGGSDNPKLIYVRALYNYFPIGQDELEIEQSDVFLASAEPPRNGWALGMKCGVWGWYPEEYVVKLNDQELQEFRRKEEKALRIQREHMGNGYVESQKDVNEECGTAPVLSNDSGSEHKSSLLRGWIHRYATIIGIKRKGKGRKDVIKGINSPKIVHDSSDLSEAENAHRCSTKTAKSSSGKSSVNSLTQELKYHTKRYSDNDSSHSPDKLNPRSSINRSGTTKKDSWHGIVSSLKTLHFRLFSKNPTRRTNAQGDHYSKKAIARNEPSVCSSQALRTNSDSVQRIDRIYPSTDESNINGEIQGDVSSTNDTAVVASLNASRRSIQPHSTANYRDKALAELINTERTYVRDLEIIINTYMVPIMERALLQSKDVEVIFSNIESVHSANKFLLGCLEGRLSIKSEDVPNSLGTIFLHAANLFKVYTLYCSNLPYAFLKIRSFHESQQVSKFLSDRAALPESRGFPLTMFMIKPVQRICKYPALIEKILKYTPPEHKDYECLKMAKERIDTVLMIINDGSCNANKMVQLCDIQEKFANKINIVSPNRILIDSGLFRISIKKFPGSYRTAPGSKKERRIYLFNDMLVIAKLPTKKRKELKLLESISFDNLVINNNQSDDLCLRIIKDSCICYSIYFGDKDLKNKWIEHLVDAKRAFTDIKLRPSRRDIPSTEDGIFNTNMSDPLLPHHMRLEGGLSTGTVDKIALALQASAVDLMPHPGFSARSPLQEVIASQHASPLSLSLNDSRDISDVISRSQNNVLTHETPERDTPADVCSTDVQQTQLESPAPCENLPLPVDKPESVHEDTQTPLPTGDQAEILDEGANRPVEVVSESTPHLHQEDTSKCYTSSEYSHGVSLQSQTEKTGDALNGSFYVSMMGYLGMQPLSASTDNVNPDSTGAYLLSSDTGCPSSPSTAVASNTQELAYQPPPNTAQDLQTGAAQADKRGDSRCARLSVIANENASGSHKAGDQYQSNTDDIINEPAIKYVGFTLLGEDSGTELEFSARRRSMSAPILKRKAAPKPPTPLALAYIDNGSSNADTGSSDNGVSRKRRSTDGPADTKSPPPTVPCGANLIPTPTYADEDRHNRGDKTDTGLIASDGKIASPSPQQHTSPHDETETISSNNREEGRCDRREEGHELKSAGSESENKHNYLVGLSVADIVSDNSGIEHISRPVKSAAITGVYIADNSVLKYLQSACGEKKGDSMSSFLISGTGTKYLYSIEVEYVYKCGKTIEAAIYRTYENFFDLHLNLIGTFAIDAGVTSPLHNRHTEDSSDTGHLGPLRKNPADRLLPPLPCQMMVVTCETARMRIPLLQRYIDSLLSLPSKVSRSPYVLSFFKPVNMKIKTRP